MDARISPFFPLKAKLYIEMLGSGILEGEVVNFTIDVSLQKLIDSFDQGGSTYSNLTTIHITLQAEESGSITSSLVVVILEPNELTGEERIECFVPQELTITETIEIDFVAELLTVDGMRGLSWKNIGGGDCGIQQFLVENVLREEDVYRVNLVLESLTERYSPSEVNEKLGFTYKMIGVRIGSISYSTCSTNHYSFIRSLQLYNSYIVIAYSYNCIILY